MSSGEPALVYRARDLHKSYRSGEEHLRILQGLDLDLRAGEIVAVLGTSGVGKSTLLHLLGLLDSPDQGSLELEGRDLSSAGGMQRDAVRNRSIGFVFQFFHLVPELTALENVLLPARIETGLLDWLRVRGERRERARALLDQVGLGGRVRHRPAHLSGGERQRVAIARALMNEPRVLLCDEPTGNLDPETSRGVWDVLRGFRGTTRAILVVTHNEHLAADADRVLRLRGGRLVDGAAAAAV
ncbi:MAG: ABC transporter ATP-binding protein [Planctomycetaceae bacterium]|nr:ABC transporter ATP-binding protein [Planctomycetota bacterium]NUN51550.1 ABC transporter ATP-binding protein [Planctomycetaceae bacterium]